MSVGLNDLAPLVSLAPMAGVTDLPFRLQAKRFGANYCVSEMIASDALSRARSDMVRRAAGAGRIAPLVIQLAGREPQWMSLGAKLAQNAGADVIDINMGCPAKSVTTGLSGSALMREPDRALALIEATVAATTLPVTVKMRLGWDDASRNAVELARRAEAAGAAMIVVHGRTRCQFFSGAADWSAIADVVKAVRIPVIANGDIASAADARRALRLSGAAGVMIGRAAQGKPWLIGALERALRCGGEAEPPPLEVLRDSLLELYEETLSLYGVQIGSRVARKHLAWSVDAIFGEPARPRRKAICTLTDPNAVRRALLDLFDQSEGRAAA